MKKFSKYLLIGLISSSVMYSCGTDEDDIIPTPVLTASDYLVGSWLITGLTLSPGLDTNLDGTIDITDALSIPGAFEPCEKDDLITFASDKTVKEEAGATACPNDTLSTGVWALMNSDKDLTITWSDGDKLEFKNVSVNATTFTATTTDTDIPLQTLNVTLTKQ